MWEEEDKVNMRKTEACVRGKEEDKVCAGERHSVAISSKKSV